MIAVGFLILQLARPDGGGAGDPAFVREQALGDAQAVLVPLSEVEVWASAAADDHAAWEQGSGGSAEAAASRDELAGRIARLQGIEPELEDPTGRLRPALQDLFARWQDADPVIDAHANCRVRDEDCSVPLVELRRALSEVREAAARAADTVQQAVA